MATRTPVISLFLLAAACGNVEPLGSGSMLLNWQVSPSGCDDAGILAVEVRAVGPDAVVERFACTSSQALITDITPGTYKVEIHGFDASGRATFVSTPETLEVEADRTLSSPTVRLLAAPAQVDVRWTFDNGRVCGANGASAISIGVFDEYDYEVETARFSCDAGEGRVPPLRAGSYLIEVNATDDDTIVWRGTAPLKVGRAEERVIDVELEAVE